MVKLKLNMAEENRWPTMDGLIEKLNSLIFSVDGNNNITAELVDSTPAKVGEL